MSMPLLNRLLCLIAPLMLGGLVYTSASPPQSATSQKRVDFNRDILPILRASCFSCHGPDKQRGGLRLDRPEGALKGGVSGAVLLPGKSGDSLLVKRITGQEEPRMPMGAAPLSSRQIALIRAWIDEGADWRDSEAGEGHWAYLKPVRPDLPKVRNKAWPRSPIDYFVLARMEKEGLQPSPEAPRETLIRRLSLDLTGLPPTLEEVDAFLKDKNPNAYEKVVDRLLASPHYGERWAKLWLDLARYADTNGYEKDLPRKMWLYRDWLIQAFNRNRPFDKFTIDQMAGDLLPIPTQKQRTATGFHRNTMLNDEGGIDPEEFRVVAVMDRVDTTANVWLGTTLGCAQCHDHKYDPFTQKDYYRFFAFFDQTEDNGRDPAPVMQVFSPEQRKTMDEIQTGIRQAEQALNTQTHKLEEAQHAWEEQTAKSEQEWVVLAPGKLESDGGSTLSRLKDGSILAGGINPENDTYTITASTSAIQIASLRLIVLPHESLPHGSTGRHPNGSFVLSKIEVRHGLGHELVPLKSAGADYTQPGHSVMDLIGSETSKGWAVSAYEPLHRIPHTAQFNLEEPLTPEPGSMLMITLKHSPQFPYHNLGRFMLMVNPRSESALASPLPSNIQNLLNIPADKRTEEQRRKLSTYYRSIAPELQPTRDRLVKLRKAEQELLEQIPTTLVMKESDKPRITRLLKRGDFRLPDEVVEPGVPAVLGSLKADQPANRLGLARWLTHKDNPLTARVTVNRFWEQLFGSGLVTTLDDFGTRSEPPSHPELLDWLATEFMRLNWNVKALLKRIVMSATYRQSSHVTSALLEHDPQNRLLARGPRFRVDAETVRDIVLAVSGRLNPKIGGPSVMPPQPPGIWENSFAFYDTPERWKDDQSADRYRRGIYTYWRRTAPYPMALTFDTNSRDVCNAKRNRTNTPLQALNTLNDPVFIEAAGGLAQQIIAGSKRQTPSARAIYGFRLCLSRAPKPVEVKHLVNLYHHSRRRFEADTTAAQALIQQCRIEAKTIPPAELAAWILAANVLLNLDETITKG